MKQITLIVLCFINLSCSDIFRSNSISRHDTGNNLSAFLTSLLNILKKINIQGFNSLVKNIIRFGDIITQSFFPPPGVPQLPQDTWWGYDHSVHQDTDIRPFYTKFKPERIKRLLYKLKYRENFTEPLHGAAMTYGTNTDFLDHVLDYWLTKYDFDAREQKLNTYPQYMTNVQGLDIQFIHLVPNVRKKKVIPLLMLHGWPTNLEFITLFPKLITPRHDFDFVFEIVAPTIPGYGYSQGTSKIGLAPYQIGIIFKNLMKRLGFKNFYIHGGDFGQIIASDMITMYPNDILGLHTNLPYSFLPQTLVKYALGALYPSAVVQAKYADRMYPISARLYYYITKFGYFHMQATQPDNVGVGIFDSPSALASWLINCFSPGTNPNNIFFPNGKLLDTYKIDDLLDIFTTIWDAECIITSMRIYAETTAVFQNPIALKIQLTPTEVPYAAIKFRHEVIYQPDAFLKDKYRNLVHSTTVDFGGHFPALEAPDFLAKDIWKSIDKMIQFNYNQTNHKKWTLN